MNILLILLAVAGAFLRLLSADPEPGRAPLLERLLTLALSAAAGWMLASAAGLWTPWWPVLVVALAGTALSLAYAGKALRPLLDASIMLWLALLAVPTASWPQLALLTIGYPALGLAADRMLGGILPRARLAGTAAALLIMVVAIPLFLLRLQPPIAPHWHQLLSAGVSDRAPGRLERLPSGGALWLADACPDRVALVLHGHNADGSHQYAAAPLRRALLHRCITVASLDHLGFGETPAPAAFTPPEGWDPLPNVLEAKSFIRARYPDAEMILIGHSMGTNSTLRLMGMDTDLDSVLLFGSAVSDPPDNDTYWFSRFVDSRGVDEGFSYQTWQQISTDYYDPASFASALSPDHPPLVFVRFEHEHDNLVAQRDPLFELIPGRKLLADYRGTTHYFNAAHYRRRVIFADVGSARRLGAEIETWLADLETLEHAPMHQASE